MEIQLAARDDHRPLDLHPAVIHRAGGPGKIATKARGLLGASASEAGQSEAVADTANEIAAEHFNGPFMLEKAKRFLNNFERQPQEASKVQTEKTALGVQMLQNE